MRTVSANERRHYLRNVFSHWLRPFNVMWSSVKSSHIPVRAISQEMPQPSITKIRLKITYLKFHSIFPGANELNPLAHGKIEWNFRPMSHELYNAHTMTRKYPWRNFNHWLHFFDNLQCNQWWKFRQNDISVSLYITLHSLYNTWPRDVEGREPNGSFVTGGFASSQS